jgi:hypothetical protein
VGMGGAAVVAVVVAVTAVVLWLHRRCCLVSDVGVQRERQRGVALGGVSE